MSTQVMEEKPPVTAQARRRPLMFAGAALVGVLVLLLVLPLVRPLEVRFGDVSYQVHTGAFDVGADPGNLPAPQGVESTSSYISPAPGQETVTARHSYRVGHL